MLDFACYLCFRPRFMSDHPELYYWIGLLPIALLAFWFIRYHQGKLSPKDALGHAVGAGVAYFVLWKMGMFRLLIYPLLLGVFGFFLFAIVRAKPVAKMVAGGVLALFFLTGVYAHHQRSSYGAYWELSKTQGEGSFSWLANAAKENRFTREQLLGYVKSDDPLIRKNAGEIAVLMGKEEKSLDEARQFGSTLNQIDPGLAGRYFENLPSEIQMELLSESKTKSR